jgi:hypothetical protein
MSQYNFYTRVLGPTPKDAPLTLEELDSSLLFLSSSLSASLGDLPAISQSVSAISQSVVELTAEVLILSQSISEIEIKPLSGSNYIFVEANGTPTQNALLLSASYVAAKDLTLTSINRFSVLVAPGKYQFTSDFILDTQYIDIVSLTGEKDVYLIGTGSISVTANDVYVRGIDVGNNNFEIATNLNLLKVKNCKGGDESFGGTPDPLPGNPASPGITVAGTFIDCEGGNYSFGGNGSAYGTFINCIGGSTSFGNMCNGTFTNCVAGDESFAFGGDIEGGTMENCVGGADSFAPVGFIKVDATLKNCTGGSNSFASGIDPIDGLLFGCRLTSGNFTQSITNIQGDGKILSCINDDNTEANS